MIWHVKHHTYGTYALFRHYSVRVEKLSSLMLSLLDAVRSTPPPPMFIPHENTEMSCKSSAHQPRDLLVTMDVSMRYLTPEGAAGAAEVATAAAAMVSAYGDEA